MSEVSTVTLAGPEMSPIVGNQKYATVPAPSSDMPGGIPYIVGNEAAERFSYYGVVAILVVFLTHHLRDASGALATLEEHRADEWGHHFSSACYFFPIFGAILSDWFLGKYRTIMAVSILYCAGHAVLALMDFPELTGIDPKLMLFAGLALIAVGAGGIKPCVSAHVGDQFVRSKSAFDVECIRLVLFLDERRLDRLDVSHAGAFGEIWAGLGIWRAGHFHGTRGFRVLARAI